MKTINDILKKYDIKPNSYRRQGSAIIVDTKEGTYVIKETDTTSKKKTYNYLMSRNFNYYPEVLGSEEDYEITQYQSEIDIPSEQKILDLVDLVSLLHNKTTFYKEVEEDYFKKIYEDISNNIEYLNSYYRDIIDIIESNIYMSPKDYLLARNISLLFSSINYATRELETWYELVKEKKKTRFVVLHNNLKLDHFIRNSGAYLVSWDKSKIDLPIFDLYKLYKNHSLDFDFEYIFKQYEKNYPLLKDEKILFNILISLPDKLEFDSNEYEMCLNITREMNYISKTENFIASQKKEETTNK